ncbi:TetR/AcrR family transcriptional regulator [Cellulomonas septica]|uniref:TetR/AcrR family transcriptional regulator n=1 Tax=Cellulomonas septica TaxID=285080 RepID=A0ABX1JY50_9CELL|nr:TetR/AcrR family transcriptional regulator [Cellulomonas septica]NKY38670.1 TetR/AcrR family transcriptional regulator [Cellulomonas septica]
MSTEVSGTPTGYARGRATREEILDAAMRLFGEVGYTSASLREVASRVGITHPGLLHHFKNKAALLEAVLQRRDEIDEAAIRTDREAGIDYFEALVLLVERNARRPAIVELFTTLSGEATSPGHPAHAYFQDRYARVVGTTAEMLEERRRAGGLRPGVDPLTAARLLVAVMDGLQVQWLLEADAPGTRVDMAAGLRAAYAALFVPVDDAAR